MSYINNVTNLHLRKELRNAINSVLISGDIVNSNKDNTIAKFNDTIVFSSGQFIEIPHIIEFNNKVQHDKVVSIKFALAEAAYILSGRDDTKLVDDFPFMRKYMQLGKMIGSYGPYFKEQLADIINKLISNKHTRQAVISVWPIYDKFSRSDKCVDVPCTNYFAFYIDSYQRINMTVVHRSSDMLLGLTYDVVFQQILLYIVSLFMQNDIGYITNIAVNRHIYTDNTGVYSLNNKFNSVCVSDIKIKYFDITRFIVNKVLYNVMPVDATYSDIKKHIATMIEKEYDIQNIINDIMEALYDCVLSEDYKEYIGG